MTNTETRTVDSEARAEHEAERAKLRAERATNAQREWRAVQQWRRDGEKGDKPATPTLDALQGEAFKPIRLTTSTSSNGNGRTPRPSIEPTPGHRFFRNGRPFSDSDNVLSSVAYQCTKGIVSDRPRITTAELQALLAKAGITDPRRTVWEYTLPNGTVIEARIIDGEPVADAPKPETAKPKTEKVATSARSSAALQREARKAQKAKSVKVDLAKDDLADAIVKATRAPKTAKADKRVRQPRKGNKPVVGIKPTPRKRAR